MNSKDKLIQDLKNEPYVKRLNEIELIIDQNEEIKELLNKKKDISKKIVLARKLGLKNTVQSYQIEYNEIDEKIANYPLVEEYMDLLDMANNDLELMVNYIEEKINHKLKV